MTNRDAVLPGKFLAMLAAYHALDRHADSAQTQQARAARAARIVADLTTSLQTPLVGKGKLAPWQLQRVTAFIDGHLDAELSIATLSALVGLSAQHFSQSFRRTTGLPPHRYIIEQRVARARHLLIETDGCCLAEIALACGFADQSHFTTAFRKSTGMSPGFYRRLWLAKDRNNGAPPSALI